VPITPITITEWNNPGAFASRHVAVGPLAHNKVLVVATGVIRIDFRGPTTDDTGAWRRATLRVGLRPDVLGEAKPQGWLPNPPRVRHGYSHITSATLLRWSPLVQYSTKTWQTTTEKRLMHFGLYPFLKSWATFRSMQPWPCVTLTPS
jgi:hypothetical protein